MAYLAGQKLRASKLPVVYELVASGTQPTLSTSVQAVTGATVTFTVTGANAYCVVNAVFDVTATVTTSNNIFVGLVYKNGVSIGGAEAHCDDRSSYNSCFCTNKVSLTGAGTYTITLRAAKAQSGGTFVIQNTHTRATVTVYDQE